MRPGCATCSSTLGHDRATIVGHSLGGGVAMQFAYQYPEMVERLVLVSSGGLGPEVSPVLRAAALPGATSSSPQPPVLGSVVGSALGKGLAAIGLRPDPDVAEVARSYASLSDSDRRAAFLATVRAVIGTDGQRIDAADRLYLAEAVPVLIVWGADDSIIPVRHGEDAHEAIPGQPPRGLRGRRPRAAARGPGPIHHRPRNASCGTPSRRVSTPRSGEQGSASPE